jgi:hypothetical protein
MRYLSILMSTFLLLGLEACSSAPAGGANEMADCCKTTADLKAQVPKCCASETSECCKASKADPSKKADCCKKAEEITAKLPACCKKAAAGEGQACCTKK